MKMWRKFFGTAALALMLCLTGLVVADTTSADFNCDICLWVVTEVQEPLTGNSTLQEVTKSVDEVCIRLPEFLSEPCDGFIGDNRGEIVRLCLQEHSPPEVCGILGFCQ